MTEIFFEFSATQKAYLEEVNSAQDLALSPYATLNTQAVRKQPYKHALIRTPFGYDTDVIIHSPFYNRYTDKTQVFSFYRNDDITRRALHVQLVSKIARTIGRALKLNLDLIEAIALGHDMGHTPFGHKGEAYLSECYQKGCKKRNRPVRYFNHNVHSVRIFRTILGSNLSLQTLNGFLTHNGEKLYQAYTPVRMETFDELDTAVENSYIDNDFHKHLRPSTLEGCVVRLSDMIAYAGKDRQDLYKARLITKSKFEEKRLIGTKNSDIISNVVINVIKNSIESPALNLDREVFEDLEALLKENYQIIYNNEQLNEPYTELIRPLTYSLYDKLIDDILNNNTASPIFTHYLNSLRQLNSYLNSGNNLMTEYVDDIVMDYIASMTDDYFIDVCRMMHVDDEKVSKIKYHEYFDFQ